ncbi:hypothetical protein DIPPA_08217 [Diplonema papillatum]|nr:hypothetical protein DIPPA_08217 [Diplonema papillatum]
MSWRNDSASHKSAGRSSLRRPEIRVEDRKGGTKARAERAASSDTGRSRARDTCSAGAEAADDSYTYRSEQQQPIYPMLRWNSLDSGTK